MKWFNSKRQLQQELTRVKQELATIKAEADAAESRGRTFEELMDVLGIRSHSGSVVNHQTALQVAAVFACVSLISGAIASIPLKIYQRKADGIREQSDHHPLLLKLCLEPSPLVTALVFWETLVTDMLLDGNAYAVIDRDLNGRVRRLIYVNPASVNVRLVEGELS
uniref:phage portal protein n=1 Tax=Endozoicomonas sp. ONNA2 TaxID=2828741 RepID=UPI002147AB37